MFGMLQCIKYSSTFRMFLFLEKNENHPLIHYSIIPPKWLAKKTIVLFSAWEHLRVNEVTLGFISILHVTTVVQFSVQGITMATSALGQVMGCGIIVKAMRW